MMTSLEGRSLSIFVVTLIFFVISFVAVCLRCFVRLRLVRAFGWDDALMLFAMVVNIMFAICGLMGSVYGMGKRFEDIEPHHIEKALFCWWLGQCSYAITCCIAKISIALGVLRLTVRGLYSIILWIVIAVTLVVCLVFWFMLTLQCHPVSFFWKRMQKNAHGHCMNIDSLLIMAWVYSITATLCDIALTVVPGFLIWNLQMNRRTKAALICILGMGGVASAAVIVRIPFLKTYEDPEFLFATTQISIWSNIEGSLGITAGCLTTLRPLFRFFRDHSYTYSRSTKPSRYGSYPLSSRYGPQTRSSRHDPEEFNFWQSGSRENDEARGVVTTIQTTQRGSIPSSQEDLAPASDQFYHGVSVQKSFTVTTDMA